MHCLRSKQGSEATARHHKMFLNINVPFLALLVLLFVVRNLYGQTFPSSELNALSNLYYATNGDEWRWSTDDVRWNFTGYHNPCTEDWYGLSCSVDGGEFNVYSLELPSFGLNGTLPDSISELTHLAILTLQMNALNGTIPPSIGTMSELEVLYLFDNRLNGTIPNELGGLTAMLYLHLDTNYLTGNIPPELGDLENLRVLDLSENSLNGTISTALGNLSSLNVLYLYSNELSGPVPAALANLTSLTDLALFDNRLNGTIPGCLSDLSQLLHLYLSGNYFTGTLPAALSNLTSLALLSTGSNQLVGTIPPEFGQLTSLVDLKLQNNHLTGTIPANLSNLVLLEELYLSGNLLSGRIPPSLGSFPVLEVFRLTSNHLTGPIPPELADLSSVLEFDIHYNMLTGTVPDDLEQLVQLQHIDISFNMLRGTIPAGFAAFTQLQQFGMDDNMFTGTLTVLGAEHTSLQLIQFEENFLTGTIPASYAQLSAAENLMLSNNLLTGTLPAGLASLMQLQGVYVNGNLLTGCLPQFGQLPDLQVLLVSKNAFGCSLDGVFDGDVQRKLVEVGLDYNRFTGTLPTELFRLPSLSIVVAISNCFSGTLPSEVCTQTSLQSLILDGLQASTSCRTKISALSSSYVADNGFHGSIPSCIFSLPGMESLHLSGNGLTGTIPSDATLGEKFLELTLSHNALTGTVPAVIQDHRWILLDLSYNLISGTLSSSFGELLQPNSSLPVHIPHTLYLQNNRLSGRIPSSLATLQNVSILGSNMFSCDADRNDVPDQDSGKDNYECGSDAFDGPYYAFLAIVFVTGVCLCVVAWCGSKIQRVSAATQHLQNWSRALDALPPSCQELFLEAQQLCKISVVCVALAVVVLVPWYSAASHYYGTYTHAYAWVVSAAFMSGLAPGLVEYFLFTVIILALCALAARNSSTHSAITAQEPRATATAAVGITEVSPWKRALAYTAFLAVNLAVVIGVNVAFVVISLTQSHAVLTVTQLLLSTFKLFWNSVCVPQLIEFAHSYLGRSDMSTTFFAVQAFVGLFNNIAIPCLVVAVLSPSCFYSVFDTPPSVTSNYIAQAWTFAGDSGVSTFSPTLAVSKYDPPFQYDYQCSSSFVTYYAPTFVYMAITAAFVMPLTNVLMLQVYQRAPPTSAVHKLLSVVLPRLLKPVDLASASAVLTSGAVAGKPHLKATKLLITLFIYLGILLTFGVVFPPLAVAMCCALLSATWQARLGLGRMLYNVGQEGVPAALLEVLDKECLGAATVEKMQCGLFLIVCFACCFFPLFLFDTMGDAVGLQSAYWVLIVMPLTPVVVAMSMKVCNFGTESVRVDEPSAMVEGTAVGVESKGAMMEMMSKSEAVNVMHAEGVV